jgi:hypothetical protein
MVKTAIDRPWEEVRADVDMSKSHTEIFIALDITAPPIPSNLSAIPIPGGDAINISWTSNEDNNDTQYYEIHYKDKLNIQWVHLANIPHPTDQFIFSNKSLINGSKIEFMIRAWDKISLPSEFSEPVTVIHRDYLAPNAPTKLSADTVSESIIELNWEESPDNDVLGYRVFMDPSRDGPNSSYSFIAELEINKYVVKALLENTTYYFLILAFDEANNTSPFSNIAANKTFIKYK